MRFSYLRWVLPVFYLSFLAPFVLHSTEQVLPQKPLTAQATSPVSAQLISEEASIQAGHPFWVGVELKIADGWDTYWINPGDAGFPTKVEWQLPEGFTAGPLQWPTPERFESQSLVGFGYTHSIVLLAQITPPAQIKSDQVDLQANVSWLACKEQCIPGQAHVQLTLPATANAPSKDTKVASQFQEAREHLPSTAEMSAKAQGQELIFSFKPAGEISEAVFIPEVSEVIDYAAPQKLEKSGDVYTLNVKMVHPENSAPEHVKGVLVVGKKGESSKKGFFVDAQVVKTSSAVSHGLNFPIALVFAFLGGLILNVMPCVLPVIALKIFSFVKMSGEKRGTILKHGGAFAFGVLVSFWILSVLLLVLRAFGHGLGWGFQLQEPLFVVALTIVLFLLALSLFGVFEMGTSLISLGNTNKTNGSPLGGSFMSGVLATLVATPCTGPLLGPALGFAMTLPPISSLTIFTMMGLGMSAPYLVFAAFPHLVRFLPKPGNWMIVFKQLMGFLMIATCLWLLWVFAAQTSEMALFILLGSLLVIAVGSWIYGHFTHIKHTKKTRWLATIVAALIVFGGSAGAVMTAKAHKSSGNVIAAQTEGGWEAYSPEKVAQLRKEGTPVFIDFTAKWCLICQANKVVLHSSEMQKEFEKLGVVTMTADWTKKDQQITEALSQLGRSGVPVYVLYSGNPSDPPYILPQTLTGSIVKEYLAKLK